jgi:hypothetical protein
VGTSLIQATEPSIMDAQKIREKRFIIFSKKLEVPPDNRLSTFPLESLLLFLPPQGSTC